LVDWKFARRATFHFEYRYKLDESGRFEEEGSTRRFSREKEGSNQKVLMKIGYDITSEFSVQSGQFVEVAKRYNIDGEKELESHTQKVQIYNEATFKRQVTRKTSLNLKLKQTQSASVPIFSQGASIARESRGMEWEASASLRIEL